MMLYIDRYQFLHRIATSVIIELLSTGVLHLEVLRHLMPHLGYGICIAYHFHLALKLSTKLSR